MTNLSKILNNERGDALAIAMVMAVACTLTGLALLQYTAQVEENSRRPRVKSMMAATEAKVRELLMTPGSYQGCASELAAGASETAIAASRRDCGFRPTIFDAVKRPVPGAKCAGGTGCGISITKTFVDKTAARSAHADIVIHYEGTEISLQDIRFTMDIPADVIQDTGTYRCPLANAPKFLGYNANGTINCKAIPGTAGPGSFVKKINLADLSMETEPLNQTVDCTGSGGIIGSVRWANGGTSFTANCIPRPPPFAEFGFVPGSGSATDPSYTTNMD